MDYDHTEASTCRFICLYCVPYSILQSPHPGTKCGWICLRPYTSKILIVFMLQITNISTEDMQKLGRNKASMLCAWEKLGTRDIRYSMQDTVNMIRRCIWVEDRSRKTWDKVVRNDLLMLRNEASGDLLAESNKMIAIPLCTGISFMLMALPQTHIICPCQTTLQFIFSIPPFHYPGSPSTAGILHPPLWLHLFSMSPPYHYFLIL